MSQGFTGSISTITDLTITNTLTVNGNVSLDGGSFTFNASSADLDFLCRGNSDNQLFKLDAGDDAVLVGMNANTTDFSATKLIVSQADTAYTSAFPIAIVGEADGDSGSCAGIHGIGRTDGANTGTGVWGVATVTAGADGGTATGGYFTATAVHAGGNNIAVYGNAANGAIDYSFYGAAGTLYNADTVLVGSDASTTDFSAAKAIISQGDTGETQAADAGLVAEGVSAGTNSGRGILSYGVAKSAASGMGVFGVGLVDATGDTGIAYGGYFASADTHAGADNIGVYANASGGDDNLGVDVAGGVLRLNNNGIAADTNNIDANKYYISAGDLSPGNTQLELYGEGTALSVSVATASTHKMAVLIEGVQYYILLTNV